MQLQKQIDGNLPKHHIYQLGYPCDTLLACGFPNFPIELSARNLLEHSKKERHQFKLKDMKGLVKALQKPIAVFTYGKKDRAQNVIIEKQQGNKKYLVGVHFNTKIGIEILSVRGIFPKDVEAWLNWIHQGKLLYINIIFEFSARLE